MSEKHLNMIEVTARIGDRAELVEQTGQGGALDQLCINTIRTLSMDAVQAANSSHPGTPTALAPLIYTLWQRLLRFNPEDPDLAESRSLRAVKWACLDAALCGVAPRWRKGGRRQV